MRSNRAHLSELALACVAIAFGLASCGDDDRPKPPGSADEKGGVGGAPAPPVGGRPPSDTVGGAPGEDGVGGAVEPAGGAPSASGGQTNAGEGGGTSAGAGGEFAQGPDAESDCPAAMSLDEPEPVGDAYGTLSAVTADELVAAWVEPMGDGMLLRTAFRTAANRSFGAPVVQEIDTPDPVALSPDGLELTFVNADRRGMSLMVRAALDEPFEPASPGMFSLIAEAMANAPEAQLLADPVLTPDGLGLFYSLYGDDSSAALRQSRRFSPYAPWPEGAPVLLDEESAMDGVLRLHPTATSADSKTLFLFDEEEAEVVAFRVARDGARYTRDTALRGLTRVVPNLDCTRVYYSEARDPTSFVSDVIPRP